MNVNIKEECRDITRQLNHAKPRQRLQKPCRTERNYNDKTSLSVRSFSVNDAISEFKTAMLGLELIPHSSIIADGKIHRCGTVSRESGKDGVYCLYLNDGIPAGWFQNHRTGEWQTWSLKTKRRPTRAEQTTFFERMTRDRQHRDAELFRQHEQAAARAMQLWNTAKPADDNHEYLIRKQVKAHGIRKWRGRLIIPVYDASGQIQSLQFISPDGAKRFLFGGKLTGGRFLIGREPSPDDVILIGEGYATMATLNTETHYPCFVAFCASNLEHAAISIRARYPKAKIVICGDNDAETEAKTGRNPGIEAAKRAAAACNGNVAFPPKLPGVSDFNDWAQYLKSGTR
jgi:putative DNA primase/helicase